LGPLNNHSLPPPPFLRELLVLPGQPFWNPKRLRDSTHGFPPFLFTKRDLCPPIFSFSFLIKLPLRICSARKKTGSGPPPVFFSSPNNGEQELPSPLPPPKPQHSSVYKTAPTCRFSWKKREGAAIFSPHISSASD